MRMKVKDVETLDPVTVDPGANLESLASTVTERGIVYVVRKQANCSAWSRAASLYPR
jgi:hypothetical protein